MANLKVNQTVIREFCEKYMDTHTDWTGTRVETKQHVGSIDDFIKMLMIHIENNQNNI